MWRRLTRSALVASNGVPPAGRAGSVVKLARVPRALLLSQQLSVTARLFSSDAGAVESLNVRGIALQELATRSWDELKEKNDITEMMKARQTLPMLWKKVSSNTVTPDVVEQFFAASQQCNLFKLQWEVFKYMEDNHPHQVSYEMYGKIFSLLTTNRNPEKMRAVFERAMSRYDPEQGRAAPEIIYRFGIASAIALNDYAEIQALMHRMVKNGVKPSPEIVTRVMVAQAKHGDAKIVLSTAEKLDVRDGQTWHEADVNRAIASLGIAGAPDAAFEFYRRSQSRLSANTLMSLMHVCRANARPKHALAILANRRRFGLKMLPSQYRKLLEIMEELDIGGAPANEMALLLNEMHEEGISFDNRVNAVIARNQRHLLGTSFMVTPSATAVGGENVNLVATQRREKGVDIPLIRDLLDNRKFAEAAAIVDAYVTPVSGESLLETIQEDKDLLGNAPTVVPEWLADMAVEAYSQNREIEKVQSLMQGFRLVRGNLTRESTLRYALSRTVGLFGGTGRLRNNRITYDAFLAMQFQELAIFRVRDALARFKQYQDADATFELLKQITAEIVEALSTLGGPQGGYDDRGRPTDFMHVLHKSGELHFDPRHAVRDAMRVFVGAKNLGKVYAALDHLESCGVPVRAADYENIFGTMSKVNMKNGNVFNAGDYFAMWKNMVRQGKAPNKTILRLATPVLSSNTDEHDANERKNIQRMLINGYLQAASDRRDTVNLPITCFSTLLAVAAEVGSVDDVQAIYSDAIKSLASRQQQKGLTLDDHDKLVEMWAIVRLEKVAVEGDAPYSLALLQKMMPSPPRNAVVAVIGAGLRDANHQVVGEAIAIFLQHGYKLKPSEAESLEDAAKSAKNPDVGLQLAQFVQKATSKESVPEKLSV